jgi:hypothetical protein
MVLPYCVALHSLQPNDLFAVRGAQVERLASGVLSCYYSRHDSFRNPTAQDGLKFHETVSKIFAGGPVIQFRFPMLLNSVVELRAHLEAHAQEYESFLRKTQDMVQMDVQLSTSAAEQSASSGTEYLRARSEQQKQLESAATATRNAAAELARDWRQSKPQSGKLNCYALVRRNDLGRFRESLRMPALTPAFKMSVTGPWPAMQFFEAQTSK